MASIALVRASKSETWSLVLCLRTYFIKGTLIHGTKEGRGSQVSWECAKLCQHTLNSTPPGAEALGRWARFFLTV